MRVTKRAIEQPITIIRDDREKQPWDEAFLGKGFTFEVKRLLTGDYTLKGMERIVCIERKASWEEIAVNVGSKQNRQNFIKELRRMQDFPVRLLVVHDSISNIGRIKTHAVHVTPQTVMNWALNIVLEYGVQLFPVGKYNSEYMVAELFRRLYEYNRTGRLHYFDAAGQE